MGGHIKCPKLKTEGRLGGRLSEVVGPAVEEAIERWDAPSLTGPSGTSTPRQAPPPPPPPPLPRTALSPSPPRPPRPPPPPPPPQQPQILLPIRPKAATARIQNKKMGTVLSFSPRDRRGSGYPTAAHQHPTDFTLNNFNYEQLNNAKNRENKGTSSVAPAPTNQQPNNNSLQNNNINLNNDNARIISEKNALDKNLKKHSLFINALSWKRFSTTNNNKKKLDNKNKNITFRQPLDNIPIVDKNKNIQTPQVSYPIAYRPFTTRTRRNRGATR